jgi:hypothetical protein
MLAPRMKNSIFQARAGAIGSDQVWSAFSVMHKEKPVAPLDNQ